MGVNHFIGKKEREKKKRFLNNRQSQSSLSDELFERLIENRRADLPLDRI